MYVYIYIYIYVYVYIYIYIYIYTYTHITHAASGAPSAPYIHRCLVIEKAPRSAVEACIMFAVCSSTILLI